MLGFTKRYYMSHLPWDKPSQIEVISGAFCLLRKKALDEIGLLDETFFMYGEDIDLSYRLLKGGWQNWYLPYSIIHFKGKSTQKSDYRYVHIFYQAMLIFFRKHYGHLSFFYTTPVKIAIYFRAAIAVSDLLRKKLHL
jgi:GT2 family glycosyltransferase